MEDFLVKVVVEEVVAGAGEAFCVLELGAILFDGQFLAGGLVRVLDVAWLAGAANGLGGLDLAVFD